MSDDYYSELPAPDTYRHGEEFQITVRRIGRHGCYTTGWQTLHYPDCPWGQKHASTWPVARSAVPTAVVEPGGGRSISDSLNE